MYKYGIDQFEVCCGKLRLHQCVRPIYYNTAMQLYHINDPSDHIEKVIIGLPTMRCTDFKFNTIGAYVGDGVLYDGDNSYVLWCRSEDLDYRPASFLRLTEDQFKPLSLVWDEMRRANPCAPDDDTICGIYTVQGVTVPLYVDHFKRVYFISPTGTPSRYYFNGFKPATACDLSAPPYSFPLGDAIGAVFDADGVIYLYADGVCLYSSFVRGAKPSYGNWTVGESKG